MRKAITLFLILFILYPTNSIATNSTIKSKSISKEEIIDAQEKSINIGSFLSEAERYTKDVFTDTDFSELLNQAITGKINNKNLAKNILNVLGKETLGTLRTIASIMIVIIIHSILKSISDGLENKGVSKIAYYVQYILIVTIIMVNYADIIVMLKTAVTNLVAFSNTLIPILITLIITTGNIVSSNMLQPVLIFIITFIGNFILDVIIPVLLASTALGIISKISSYAGVERLSKFFKSGVIWVLGLVLTLFVSLVSIEGSLSANVDGLATKTTKAAVSSFIPIVGKILGDAVDTVIGCASVLKNAVGIIGVIVIIGICIMPIIKLVLIMISYYIGACICEPIADENIVKLLSEMGDTFKVMLAILCSISVMLIIGTSLVLKISNSSLMYR